MRKLLLPLMLCVACGAPLTTDDAGQVDAGLAADAGTDAGALPSADAGPADAGTPDAGPAMLVVSARFPNALARTGNLLEVTVSDASGATVSAALVVVDLFMPAHGHGAPAPTVTASGALFTASVAFTMPGTWEVTVTATSGSKSATKILSVLVP